MKQHKRGRPRHGGFSLVELIVVIAIIGILATVVIVRFAGKTDQARAAAAKSQIAQLEGAIVEFEAHCGRMPRALDELVNKPSDAPKWQEGGYLKNKRVSKDPWQNEYVYRTEGSGFEIVCLGSDGKEGGSGSAKDISSRDLNGEAE